MVNNNKTDDEEAQAPLIEPLLRRPAPNATSQVAIVGATVCPIESLDYEFGLAFAVFACSNLGLTLFSSILTDFVSPTAAGSGIPEVKAYLNGVDAPGIFTLRTLIVKIFS
ncbi:hypothetical protein GIB67_032582 [Kingdonia uniflora]|uniref:Uncharacterized protein n=1 Tax=Kingdonia uniflora TaxID=39325 RepID=A0A7J7LS95_9MAGN|nr:hypothetical protein GIB67_032582 [Kingdonia uniflora]